MSRIWDFNLWQTKWILLLQWFKEMFWHGWARASVLWLANVHVRNHVFKLCQIIVRCCFSPTSYAIALYKNFVVNFYQILSCMNYLCTMTRLPFVLKQSPVYFILLNLIILHVQIIQWWDWGSSTLNGSLTLSAFLLQVFKMLLFLFLF